jgi:hypothetical protein
MESGLSPSGRQRKVELVLGFLAVLLPLLLHAPFFSSEAIVYRADAAQLQYPRYRILCDALQIHHSFPLWQDLVYGGSPFHASPENPTLYPPVLLFAAFAGPVLAINLVILTGLAAAALGMYLFVLRLWKRLEPEAGGVAAAGAFVAAQCFALNHWTRVDHLNLVTYGHAHALFPWILIAAGGVLQGARPLRAAGWLALLVAADVHTGGLYVFPYVCLSVGVWFALHGLLGGPQARARTLKYGTLAAVFAGLMVASKIVPYLEWVPTTNRGEPLSYADALERTLGGPAGAFKWKAVWANIQVYTGGGWGLLPMVVALPLVKHGVVRTILGLTLFFFAVALGGVAHRFLVHIPPFGDVRGAWRAWCAIDLFWPMASGLGVAWLLSRVPSLRRSALLAGLFGLALGMPLAWRLFHSTPRHDGDMHYPNEVSEVLTRYVNWPSVAELAGDDWRAFYIDKVVPEDRNEQFVTSELGIETPAGYLGHVWPWRLERHVYGEEDERPLDPAVRHRRLAVLSTRYFVTHDPERPAPDNGGRKTEPVGIDGTAVALNPIAIPRAFAPAAVAAIAGDVDDELMYGMLDRPELPVQHVGLVAIEAGTTLSAEEWTALDLLVVGGGSEEAAALAAEAHERKLTVVELPLPLDDVGRAALVRVAERLAEDAASGMTHAVDFERVRPGETSLRLPSDAAWDGGRFVVVSEPWSWYPGWSVTSGGDQLALHRADGVVTTVFVPKEATELNAVYAPRSFVVGLVLGALGLLLAVGALARRPAEEQASQSLA